MSLINNMLKDLEKRSQGNRYKKDLKLVTPKISTPQNSSLKKIYSWIGIGILFIFFAFSFVLDKRKIKISPLNPYSSTALADEKELIQPDDQILLKNFALTKNNNITTLSLRLNKSAYYTFDYDYLMHKAFINIYNAQLSGDLPNVIDHSIVKNVSYSKHNDVLTIGVDMQPDSKILELDQATENGDALLKLSLNRLDIDPVTRENGIKQNTQPDKQESKPIASIKTPAKQSELHEKYLAAVIDLEQGRINSANKKLISILNQDPEYHDARSTYVALLLKKSDTQLAMQELNNGLKLNPDYIPFIELKARLLVSENKFNSALVLLKTVSPEIKNNQNYYSLLALLYEKLDMNQLAAQTYQQLLSTNQHNGNWWLGLGLALEKLGQSNSAADAYRHALTGENLNSDTLAYVQSQLNSIEGLQ